MARPFIPASVEDLSPDWLTRTLREKGFLREARVTAVRSQTLGVGQGFVGDLSRVSFELDREEPDVPRSLIAKFPTQANRRNRGFAQMSGIYEREIRFYRELAPRVQARTPRLYFGDFDPTPGAERGQSIARAFGRLPFWLLRILTRFLAWLSAFARNRYALLLEDLEPARVGDQVAGCSTEAACRSLATLARIHAAWWNDPSLESLWWLAPIDLQERPQQRYFEREHAHFVEAHRPRLTPAALRQLDWLETHGGSLLRRFAGPPFTLLHTDFRLDNLFFDDRNDEVIVIDWQSPMRGMAAWDVAYFLSGSLRPDVREADERIALDGYHEQLVAGGVDDYTRNDLERDYRLGLLLVLHRLALLSTDLFEVGGNRGEELIDTWVDRVVARLGDFDPPGLRN